MAKRIYPAPSCDPERHRKALCDRLARACEDPAGQATIRLLQSTALLSPSEGPLPPVSWPEGEAEAIGYWFPTELEGRLVWQRTFADARLPRETLEAEPSAGVTRICYVGESAAQGLFYAPDHTPAKVALAALPRTSEICDVSQAGVGFHDLLWLCHRAMQLRPRKLVVYAGNNWLRWRELETLLAPARERTPTYLEQGAALASEGMTGLLANANAHLANRVRIALDWLTTLKRKTGVDVLFVIPATNLADIEIMHPVYWLPGTDTTAWYALRGDAIALLERDAWALAEVVARQMLSLDGGANATSWHLLARALRGRERHEEAARALESALEAGGWSDFHRLSGISATTRALLRDGCRERGLAHLDLHEGLAPSAPDGLLGYPLFVDHSHHSEQGITRVGQLIGRALRDDDAPPNDASASPPCSLTPALRALASIQAGLYDLHYNQPVLSGPSALAMRLFDDALTVDPDSAGVLNDYLVARFTSASAHLTSARLRNLQSRMPLPESAFSVWTLPVPEQDAIAAAFARRGLSLAPEVETAMLAHASARPGDDLTSPRFVDTRGGLKSGEHPWLDASGIEPRPRLVRARMPSTTFYLVAENATALSIELTLRLPQAAAARVTLSVNGRPLDSVSTGSSWVTTRLQIPAGLLKRGINRVTVAWPAPADGTRAIATAILELAAARPADLYPVFGEVFSAIVRDAREARNDDRTERSRPEP